MQGLVVLLSGGLDSATCLAVARARGFEAHALSVDYGQRHRGEVTRPGSWPGCPGRRATGWDDIQRRLDGLFA